MLSFIRLFAALETVAHQAPLSMGSSRQEYWRGLPFPFLGDLPKPGTEPRSPALQADSLPAEPQVKPKNTGMGSLSFHHWIFLTQESNQGLLQCREILYQLSYQGIPVLMIVDLNFQSDNSNIPAMSGSDVCSVSSDSLLISLVIFY